MGIASFIEEVSKALTLHVGHIMIMIIKNDVYRQVMATVGHFRPESGGIIALDKEGVISDFYFDAEAGFGKASYKPTRLSIQNYIRAHWSVGDTRFCGIVHSHPLCNTCVPSYIDVEMAQKIMEANNMALFYLLMVKGSEIALYRVSQNDAQCKQVELEIK